MGTPTGNSTVGDEEEDVGAQHLVPVGANINLRRSSRDIWGAEGWLCRWRLAAFGVRISDGREVFAGGTAFRG